jgi:hypothetical protein
VYKVGDHHTTICQETLHYSDRMSRDIYMQKEPTASLSLDIVTSLMKSASVTFPTPAYRIFDSGTNSLYIIPFVKT